VPGREKLQHAESNMVAVNKLTQT